MHRDFHVVILGGGLASLTLAMQIKQQRADVSIAILEKRDQKAPLAAHKVGESTVELGTYYLREVLGLNDYLDENHLVKHGLRFYFASPEANEPIDQRVEYGTRKELFSPSHQIDRGKFENDMMEKISDMGVAVKMGIQVSDVDLSDEGHVVHYIKDGAPHSLTADWVVDATGRRHFLKRKEGLKKDLTHDVNAAWFRVEGEIDVAEWSENTTWRGLLPSNFRRLGTVHFMGTGYWVWFIPLASGNTSIGIVADPRYHDFSTLHTLDKAFEWLEKNEPLCAEKIADKRDAVLDFRVLKKFSFNSTQFYSPDKWGVVGEAGGFLDPFYSPGTDFIAIGNTFMSDLILRELEGEDVYTRSMVYDRVHAQVFDNWVPIYENKYGLFGNAQVMCAKISWDFGVYWGIPSLLFTNGGLTNLNVVRILFRSPNCLGERFKALNDNVQQFFEEWGERENIPLSNIYFDLMDCPFMRDFQKGITEIHPSEKDLVAQLEENLSILEKMAAEMFRVVSARLNGTPADLSTNPYEMSLNLSLDQLIEQGNTAEALAFDSKIANEVAVIWLKEKIIS